MPAMRPGVPTGLVALVMLATAGVALLRPWEAPGGGEHPSTTLSMPNSRALDPPPAADMTAGTLAGGLPFNHPPIQGGASPLPANHPPIDGTASPHDGMRTPVASPEEAPAIAWQAPAAWKTMPNPNPMRIATYRPTADSEMIVVRAGGTTNANIERWIGQFDEGAQTKRSRRTVRGLGVEVLDARGTYNGGGMMAGAPAQPHPDWSLLGAVVETPGSSYFFKWLGPSDQIQATRASFDALVGSVRPL